MAKKSQVDSSDFATEKRLLIAERTAKGISGDVSDEDVCYYAEHKYRTNERKRVVDVLHKEIITLIRKNEGAFGESAIADFQEALRKCEDDLARVRVCAAWRRMYAGMKEV